MRKLVLAAVLCVLVVPAFSAPTYWNFSGTVTISTLSGVSVGNTMTGRFWGDPDTNQLWELKWSAGTQNYQTDFSGYAILAVDPDYIVAVRNAPLDSIVFDPAPGGDYYFETSSFVLKANPLQYSTSSAPPPSVIPAPGAFVLGLIGTGFVRRFRKQL